MFCPNVNLNDKLPQCNKRYAVKQTINQMKRWLDFIDKLSAAPYRTSHKLGSTSVINFWHRLSNGWHYSWLIYQQMTVILRGNTKDNMKVRWYASFYCYFFFLPTYRPDPEFDQDVLRFFSVLTSHDTT